MDLYIYRFSGSIKSNYTYYLICSHDVARSSHMWNVQGVDQFEISLRHRQENQISQIVDNHRILRENSGSRFARVTRGDPFQILTRANPLPLLPRNFFAIVHDFADLVLLTV